MAKDVTITLTERKVLEIVSLLRDGAENAREKADAMYEESKAPYGTDIYTEEDFNAKDEEISSMEKTADRLEAQLQGGPARSEDTLVYVYDQSGPFQDADDYLYRAEAQPPGVLEAGQFIVGYSDQDQAEAVERCKGACRALGYGGGFEVEWEEEG